MIKRLFILLFLYSINYIGLSQVVDPTKVDYTRELTFGITTNTKSGLIGGLNLYHSNRFNDKNWFMYGLEIVNTQHTREIKVVGGSGASYIAGKINYLFSIRPDIGFQRTLFQKDKQDGIRLNFVCSGGPSIGLLKPYFVEVLTYKTVQYNDDGVIKDTTIQTVATEAFNPQTHSAFNILGSGGFFKGFDQTQVVLGVHAKFGLNLEFGAFESKASGLEFGFMFENYFSNIKIHNTNDNQQFWSSFYLTLYFGSKSPSKNTIVLGQTKSRIPQ